MMSSTMPSTKYSCSGSSLMFWNGSTAIEGLSGRASRGAGVFAFGGRSAAGRLRPGRESDLQRIDPDRLNDVLQLGLAEIGDFKVEPRAHLPVGVLGKTDRAGLGDPLQPRGDVDAVAHQVAVALLDDVAHVNADAEVDAAISGTPALRSTMAFCTSMAHRTASTTLRNSTMLPSPVRLTTRPLCTAMSGR